MATSDHTLPPLAKSRYFDGETNSSAAPAADLVRSMPKEKNKLPICVDLDGTLVKTDTFIEQGATFLKTQPENIYKLPLWLLKGKAHIKSMLARQVKIQPNTLPYNHELIEYLLAKKEQGHPLLLVTGANGRIAKAIAKHLGIFDGVYASDRETNLTGRRKLMLLTHLFGRGRFIYCGNSKTDLTIFDAAAKSIVVDAPASVQKKAQRIGNVSKVFGLQSFSFRTFRKALRVHQWAKNSLIFLPMLLANEFSWSNLGLALLAFFSFSFVASAGYVFNDLLDVSSDRTHPEKSKRPFASGALPVTYAPFLFVALMAGGLLLSLTLPMAVSLILLLYAAATMGYTLKFKTIMVADVLLLASFYTIRLFSGGVALDIGISAWLLAFSSFFFLSLALIKRSSELQVKIDKNEEGTISRGYVTTDHPIIRGLGSAAGLFSILVLCQYVVSDTAAEVYQHPQYLWTTCVVLTWWIFRYWILANRGHVDYDPVAFAIRDRFSYFIIFVIALSWVLARGF